MKINLLVREMSILNLEVLYGPIVIGHGSPVLVLPLLCYLLLLNHNSVGLLFVCLVSLFRL